jgi:monoamine oxidase
MSSSSDHDQQLSEEAELRELLLRDLARLHTFPGRTEQDLYNLISSNYLDHYAHDWTHDPNTAGAFAFFRP